MNIEQAISMELERRKALERAVAIALVRKFEADPCARIRRGVVQQAVRDSLGVNENRDLARVVIAWLASQGIRRVTVRGLGYFKGLKQRV